MSQLIIELPEGVKEKVATLAAEWGHGSPEAFVQALVIDATGDRDFGAPPGASVRNVDELRQLINARYDDEDGSIEADDSHFDDILKYADEADRRAARS